MDEPILSNFFLNDFITSLSERLGTQNMQFWSSQTIDNDILLYSFMLQLWHLLTYLDDENATMTAD